MIYDIWLHKDQSDRSYEQFRKECVDSAENTKKVRDAMYNMGNEFKLSANQAKAYEVREEAKEKWAKWQHMNDRYTFTEKDATNLLSSSMNRR